MRLFPVLFISYIYFISYIILTAAPEVGIVCLTFMEEEVRPQERPSNFLKGARHFWARRYLAPNLLFSSYSTVPSDSEPTRRIDGGSSYWARKNWRMTRIPHVQTYSLFPLQLISDGWNHCWKLFCWVKHCLSHDSLKIQVSPHGRRALIPWHGWERTYMDILLELFKYLKHILSFIIVLTIYSHFFISYIRTAPWYRAVKMKQPEMFILG